MFPPSDPLQNGWMWEARKQGSLVFKILASQPPAEQNSAQMTENGSGRTNWDKIHAEVFFPKSKLYPKYECSLHID